MWIRNPDTSFQFDEDQVPDPTYQFDVDPNQDPAPHQSDGNLQPLVYRSFTTAFLASTHPL
jgi:hypothetical protein